MAETVKDYLSSYQAMQAEIRDLEQRLSELREQLESVRSPVCSAMPRSKSESDLSELLSPLLDLERSYRQAVLKARVRCARIEHLILQLSSPRQKQILRARYVDGLSWDEVSGRFLISESVTYSLHKKAISELELRYGESLRYRREEDGPSP